MTQLQNSTPFRRFECCIPVRGSYRSIICDIQRQHFRFIPEALYDVLIEYEGKTLGEIKRAFNNEYDEILDEYFQFLLDEEFIFFTDTPEFFPAMDMKWDEPSHITNAIIDIRKNSKELDWGKVFNQFEELACKHIQIRSFDDKPLAFFKNILEQAENKRIVSVDLIIKYQEGLDKKTLFDFCNTYPRIFSITCHSAPCTETLHISSKRMGHIFYSESPVTDATHCGIIASDYFTLNIKSFTESQHHNTCLNRKISIDVDGNIKNCPSMKESYGNIKNTTLKEALEKPGFKKYWNIKKDEITKCKDCEFRHICTDCRAFRENPEDIYSAPLKCGYDPYTGKWEEWSKNPLKQKAIDYYGMRKLVEE